MVENIDIYPAKKRKVDDDSTNINYSLNTNNSGLSIQNNTNNSQNHNANYFIPVNYQNGQVLSRFLDRLKLKTVPHVAPLLERLVDAENRSLNALKSIDKINKRMKEVEYQVGKNIKKVIIEPVHVAVGTDITDPNSEEYRRIMSAIPSSPFAPTKLRSSQTPKPNQIPCKEEFNQHFINTTQLNNKGVFQQTNNQMIDLTSDEQAKIRNVNIMPLNNGNANTIHKLYPKTNNQLNSLSLTSQNFILNISSQHLPQNTISPHLISPTLGFKRVKDGICLQWDMVIEGGGPGPSSFDIFSFQKSSNVSNNSFPWKRIGEVEALPLPMACTLTQVSKMSTYFFAVRASIQSKTFSPWSNVVLIEVH